MRWWRRWRSGPTVSNYGSAEGAGMSPEGSAALRAALNAQSPPKTLKEHLAKTGSARFRAVEGPAISREAQEQFLAHPRVRAALLPIVSSGLGAGAEFERSKMATLDAERRAVIGDATILREPSPPTQ